MILRHKFDKLTTNDRALFLAIFESPNPLNEFE